MQLCFCLLLPESYLVVADFHRERFSGWRPDDDWRWSCEAQRKASLSWSSSSSSAGQRRTFRASRPIEKLATNLATLKWLQPFLVTIRRLRSATATPTPVLAAAASVGFQGFFLARSTHGARVQQPRFAAWSTVRKSKLICQICYFSKQRCQ